MVCKGAVIVPPRKIVSIAVSLGTEPYKQPEKQVLYVVYESFRKAYADQGPSSG